MVISFDMFCMCGQVGSMKKSLSSGNFGSRLFASQSTGTQRIKAVAYVGKYAFETLELNG